MGVVARIQTRAAMTRISAHCLWERMTDPHPKSLREVPRAVSSLTKEYLKSALCRAVPGAEVVSFEFGAGSVGTTSRCTVRIKYNDIGTQAGLPEVIFGKATPQFSSRWICGLSGAIAHEVHFYTIIRPELDIETLNCYYAAYDPGSFRSIFLFEDLGRPGMNTTFLDASHTLTRAEMDGMVRLMASFHAPYWGSTRLDTEFTWLKDALAYQHHINNVIDFGERTEIGLTRMESILPPALLARRHELWPALMRSCELRVLGPQTLLHADVHLGNWYITKEQQMGICDWQCTVKGQWAADFAYLLTSAVPAETRRGWEKEVLEVYLAELRKTLGDRTPSFAGAWLAYRQQTLHGLYNWFFVAGAGPMQPNMQPDSFGRINVERMSAAVDDLQSLDCYRP